MTSSSDRTEPGHITAPFETESWSDNTANGCKWKARGYLRSIISNSTKPVQMGSTLILLLLTRFPFVSVLGVFFFLEAFY